MNMDKIVHLFAFIAVIGVCCGRQWNHERMLYNALMSGYDSSMKVVRPVQEHSDTLNVSLGLSLININGMEQKSGEASFMMWDKMTWQDTHLQWDPKDYGNLDRIRMPIGNIWKPDLKLFNSLDAKEDTQVDQTMAVISSDGTVLWIPPTTRRVLCEKLGKADRRTFRCSFKYGSWTYDGNLVDIQFFYGVDKMEMPEGVTNAKYHICANTAVREVKKYDCCPEPYPSLKFTLDIRNRDVPCDK